MWRMRRIAVRRPGISLVLIASIAVVVASCDSTGTGTSAGSDVTTTAAATLPPTSLPPTSAAGTRVAVASTVAETLPATTAVPTTVAATVAPTTTASPATTAPPTTMASPACAGGAPIPAGATDVVTINGDVDGDQVADAISSYALDGVPHVHAALTSDGPSDVAVPIGFAETVTIAFEDIDHSLGADVPPPFVVSAVGAGNAGSAFLTFLSPGDDGCLQQWQLDGNPFVFRVSQQGPYAGLVCDGAAGSIHYVLDTVDQNADGTWTVATQALTHDGTTAVVRDLDSQVVADDAGVAAQYGNIVNCGQAPPIP